MWKPSQFSVARSLAEDGLPGQSLVFNTFSGASVLLDDETWDGILEQLSAGAELSPEQGLFAGRLGSLGILVEGELDERCAFEERFDRQRRDVATLFPIFAVTTACNIGCTYCYEEGIAGERMSGEVLTGILRWLERRVVVDGTRRVFPSLFGGEPLMYPKLLFELMDGVEEIGRRHALEYAFTSSSNGILLTSELAAELAARRLRQIQISLDGPEHIHDERRIGKRGQPSFQRSWEGIRVAVDHIPGVTVKVNFDRHNRDHISELFDFLVEAGLQDRVDVKLETIALQIGSSTVHDPAHVIPPAAPELADAYLQLMVEAKERGLRVNRETAHVTPCMFTADHGVMIGPDGSIYKCISLVGRTEHRVGTVFDEDYVKDAYEGQMDVSKRTQECWSEACAYLPVCAGGCAYESIVRTGDHDSRFCTKPYLEEWHFKRQLVAHAGELERRGAARLTSERFARRTASPLPMIAQGPSSCGSCGSDAPLLQISVPGAR